MNSFCRRRIVIGGLHRRVGMDARYEWRNRWSKLFFQFWVIILPFNSAYGPSKDGENQLIRIIICHPISEGIASWEFIFYTYIFLLPLNPLNFWSLNLLLTPPWLPRKIYRLPEMAPFEGCQAVWAYQPPLPPPFIPWSTVFRVQQQQDQYLLSTWSHLPRKISKYYC